MNNLTDKRMIEIYNSLMDRINVQIKNVNKIDIPENDKYLSDFLDDLPHDAYINKGATGCGGTTLAITNNEPYVIAVHSVNMVKNKSKQHKNLCPIYGDISKQDIKNYIDYCNYNKISQKFIVTYDSLYRVLELIDPTEFRLLVDEVQVLIRYLGHFKLSVANNLMKNSYKFKSCSFLTATPTDLDFLPVELKKLDYIEYQWPNLIKPEIKHMYCGNQLNTKVVSFILDKLDNTDDEIYIFYNSRNGVVSTIEKILAIRQDLSMDDIKIIFSKANKNEFFFRNKLKNKNINIENELVVDDNGNPLPGYNKRINFISSFGFEGVDFYTFGKNVITLIVADSKYKSMRYDISIDMPQILGRFRRDKTTNLFPKNDIFFIWKTVNEELQYDSYELLLESIVRHIAFSEELIKTVDKFFEEGSKDKALTNYKMLSKMEPYLYIEDDNQPLLKQKYIVNDYAMEGIMSTFKTMNIDYLMLGNINDKTGIISNSLREISSMTSTFEIPQLDIKHSQALNRKVPFSKIAKEYHELWEKCKLENNIDLLNEYNEQMEYLISICDLLKDVLDYNSPEYLKTYNFYEKYFVDYVNNKISLDSIKQSLKKYGLVTGSKIKCSDALQLIEHIYKDNNITEKPKKSALQKWFYTEVKMINGIKYYCILNEI